MKLLSAAVFVCGVVMLAAVALLIRRRHPEATTEELFDRLLEDRTVRVAVIAIWWRLGWHFLAGDTL